MATPQKKSSTGKKKCWKQIVTLVPCSMVNNVNNEKKWKRPCSSPRSVKDCRRELCGNGTPEQGGASIQGAYLDLRTQGSWP